MRPPDSTTGDFLSLPVKCQCGDSRSPPFRVLTSVAVAIAHAGILASSTPTCTFRCTKCKQTVIYTAGDLRMGGLR